MKQTYLKSALSLVLGILFFYFFEHGHDCMAPVVYWIFVAVMLVFYFEIMCLLWTRKSSFFPAGCNKLHPWFIGIIYLAPPVTTIILQLMAK